MDQDDLNTRPGVEAILERINHLGDDLRQEMKAMEDRLDSKIDALGQVLRNEIQDVRKETSESIDKLSRELRKEMSYGFRHVGKQIGLIGKDMLELRADQLIEDRIETLEPKAS